MIVRTEVENACSRARCQQEITVHPSSLGITEASARKYLHHTSASPRTSAARTLEGGGMKPPRGGRRTNPGRPSPLLGGSFFCFLVRVWGPHRRSGRRRKQRGRRRSMSRRGRLQRERFVLPRPHGSGHDFLHVHAAACGLSLVQLRGAAVAESRVRLLEHRRADQRELQRDVILDHHKNDALGGGDLLVHCLRRW